MLNPSIKKVVPITGGELINYNYVDIANGKGINIFYPLSTNTNGKKITNHTSGAYSTSITTVFSNNIAAIAEANDLGGSFVKHQDIDFDTTFNLPRTIEGDAIISLSHGIKAVTPATTTQSYIQAKIRKWDGTTEEDLGTASGAVLSVNAVSTGSQTIALKMNLPKTNFK